MRKVTVAVDSFKGSLTSQEVADSVAKGVLNVFPECEIIKVNVADGGEGTRQALSSVIPGRTVETIVSGPLLSPVKAEYTISQDGSTAIMDMATASGLTLIPEEKRNPLKTTTKGTGEMILDAISRGCRRIMVGLGGSATNDAGIGMLTALGFKFKDKDDNVIETGRGEDLERIEKVDETGVPEIIRNIEFIVDYDVTNPFCGPEGAAYTFAPQKGADEEITWRLDQGMKHLAEKINQYGRIKEIPGAGAAGGLGGAFSGFLKANLKPGIEMVLDAVDFDNLAVGSDLIITGEGKLDSQTIMGKAPAGVLRRGRSANIPVIAIGGAVEDCEVLNRAGFAALFSIQHGPVSQNMAMNPEIAKRNVEKTVTQIMRLMSLHIS